MTWTYSGDPSDSDRDMVRYIIGDTETDDQLVTDEEIDGLLTVQTNIYRVAEKVARNLSHKYARYTTGTLGDLTISDSQLITQFKQVAEWCKSQANKQVSPFIGGIDDALYPKTFKRGQFDNKGINLAEDEDEDEE